MTTTQTTASLHREMVEALRKVRAALDGIAAQDIDWAMGTSDNVNLLQAMAEEALYGVVTALEGWEKRPRLRDDPAAMAAIFDIIEHGDEQHRAWLKGKCAELLDALDTLLYGERG